MTSPNLAILGKKYYNPTMIESENHAESIFWDGHGFNDHCLWEKGELTLTEDQNARLQEEETQRRLREYIEKGLITLVKKFRKDEVFKMANFPLGVVVHYSYDWAEKKFFGRIAVSQIEDEWGIIVEEQSGQRLIIGFERGNIFGPFDSDFASRLYDEEIVIGKVEHERLRSNLFKRNEQLTRFKSIEIWRPTLG